MGAPDLFESYPITLLGEGLQVAHQLIVAEVPLADLMPSDGRGYGDLFPVILGREKIRKWSGRRS